MDYVQTARHFHDLGDIIKRQSRLSRRHTCKLSVVSYYFCVKYIDCTQLKCVFSFLHFDHFLPECPSHKWGPHCHHDCKCQNGAKCDSRTGSCSCTPGWQGVVCEKPCDQGYYGDKCQKQCQCLNGGTCDPVMGNCTCRPGYTGKR